MTRAAIFCGSREWADPYPIREAIDALHTSTTVITGGAAGADRIAHRAAKRRGLNTVVIHADWAQHGRAAGPIRNQQMLDVLAGYDRRSVYAFRLPGKSRGTDHMVSIARDAGIWVSVTHGDDRS